MSTGNQKPKLGRKKEVGKVEKPRVITQLSAEGNINSFF